MGLWVGGWEVERKRWFSVSSWCARLSQWVDSSFFLELWGWEPDSDLVLLVLYSLAC